MPALNPLLQGTSPIYNLLPDILSNLSKERGLAKPQFQAIMQHVRGGAQGLTDFWRQEGRPLRAVLRRRCTSGQAAAASCRGAPHPCLLLMQWAQQPTCRVPRPPQLLAYIKKDRQGDALVEKLCLRFGASDDPAQWHCIAFCLTQARRWGAGKGAG